MPSCKILLDFCNHLRRISFLTFFQLLGFISRLPSAVTLGCFHQQHPEMSITCLSDTKSVLIFTAGILARSQTEIRCILLSCTKPLKIPGFRQNGECRLSLDSKETGEFVNILGVFLSSKQFFDPLIQTLQLVYKIAVSQQVFTEDLLIQIQFCSHHTTFGSPLVAASCRIPVHFFITDAHDRLIH